MLFVGKINSSTQCLSVHRCMQERLWMRQWQQNGTILVASWSPRTNHLHHLPKSMTFTIPAYNLINLETLNELKYPTPRLVPHMYELLGSTNCLTKPFEGTVQIIHLIHPRFHSSTYTYRHNLLYAWYKYATVTVTDGFATSQRYSPVTTAVTVSLPSSSTVSGADYLVTTCISIHLCKLNQGKSSMYTSNPEGIYCIYQ